MNAIRYEEFCKDILQPLAWPVKQFVSVEVAHFASRVPIADAMRTRTKSAEIGYRWGPIWSTAWFRVRGKLTADFRGHRALLRFSSGTEACVWVDGTAHAGLDPYHDTAPILPLDWRSTQRARGGEKIDLWIEAACNLPLGATTFWWDQPEQRARWNEAKPGRLECAEIVAIDEAVWQFCQRFDWLRRMLSSGNAEHSRTNDIDEGLNAIVRAIPAGTATRQDLLAQRGALDRLLKGRASGERATTCIAIGHAHIDTAWLWRIDETRRKCVRSFATALRNIERFPNFRFLCSQAQQYQYVKEECPKLFDGIRAAVKAGKWEPNGAMWIEPDCTAPSGESFIRQITHGTSWWKEQFGSSAPQRFLYLPDTFGFPACLPQIIAKAGLDTFITNKIIWSDTNRFPHVTFNWRGLDGTEVLTHLTPGHNYNSDFLPADLQLADANIERQDKGRTRTYLQPYGWGDGGGGPDPMQIERTRSASQCEGMPATKYVKAGDFCEILHEEAQACTRRGTEIPVWDGELYLEAHRGTYTSQRWIKQANRKAEQLLRQVEMLAVLAPLARAQERALLVELDALWKIVLLHQFHDILPGSSIGPVYDDARKVMGGAITQLTALRDAGLSRAAQKVGGAKSDRVVFNPASSATIEAPACSVSVANAVQKDESLRASVREIANSLVNVRFDALGRIAQIITLDGTVQPMRGRAFNELVLYEDRPRRWEAWDTDKEYLQKPTLVITRCTMKATMRSGIATLSVERKLGTRSTIVQTYELQPWSDVVFVRTRLDWREDRTLLRALFPTRLRARTARFGTQFGHIDRDSHRNTSWQTAQFEVPGHDWMTLSDDATAFCVIDDGIFGKSAHGGMLGLTLVKSPNFPDPKSDRGVHEFVYGIRCRASWDSSDWAASDRLNNALVSVSTIKQKQLGQSQQFLNIQSVSGQFGTEISALKPASDGSGDVIVRLVDRTGSPQTCALSWTRGAKRVTLCDFFELPIKGGAISVKREISVIKMKPFEIICLRVRNK